MLLRGKAAKEFLKRSKEVDAMGERQRNRTSTPEDLKIYKEVQDRMWAAIRFLGGENNIEVK